MTEFEVTPSYINVGLLFTGYYVFRIPKYQRGYAWGDEEIDDFCKDIEDCILKIEGSSPKPHFFGGIVSAKTGPAKDGKTTCEVIDGQQRLATFIILITIIKNLFQKVSEYAQEDKRAYLIEKVNKISQYLYVDDDNGKEIVKIPKIKLSSFDQPFFAKLIGGKIREKEKFKRESHKNMFNSFAAIEDFLQKTFMENFDVESQVNNLNRVLDFLFNKSSVIHILTDERIQAYRLFQTLNDRGKNLSEGDLLKASTLEMLQGFKEIQKEVEEIWNDILSEEPEHVTKFLRWIFESHKGKRAGKTSLYDDFLDFFSRKGQGFLLKMLKIMQGKSKR